MNLQVIKQEVQVNKIIQLSPGWVALWEFIQKHPHTTFERLEFASGEPKFGTQVITESFRF